MCPRSTTGCYISHSAHREDGRVVLPKIALPTVSTGRKGRPRKEIDRAMLTAIMASTKINVSKALLARKIGVSTRTISRRMKEFGIARPAFTKMTNKELDGIMSRYQQWKPSTGTPFKWGFLRDHGIRVQRWRIRASNQRVNKLSLILRKHQAIRRRKYKVSRPNALWHLDGHHKLIAYGIVIHGIVDGFSRLVGHSSFS